MTNSQQPTTSGQPPTAGTQSEILSFLATQSTLTLATVNDQGQPLAASLFFVAAADLNLYWLSSPTSRHSLNLETNPGAAVTIYKPTWTWAEIAGVQMEGEARALAAGVEWAAAGKIYRAKFPFVREFEAEITRSTFYIFTPRWVRLVDNAPGFGHKQEMAFRENAP